MQIANKIATLDAALSEASVVCHQDDAGRAVVYCSTNSAVADAATGEAYLVFPSASPMRHHLRDDQGWRPVYTVTTEGV